MRKEAELTVLISDRYDRRLLRAFPAGKAQRLSQPPPKVTTSKEVTKANATST
jgi:hypothetical protein